MSEAKTKKTSTYAFGTGVWVKVFKRIWWPGIVVDPLAIPQDSLDCMKIVEHTAIVKFEHNNKYQVVGINDQIFLYSCDRKMQFVERGLSLYKNQKKGLPVVGKFDMDNFKKDVMSMERLIGGDMHIFENVENDKKKIKFIVSEYFTPTNTKKSKKKEVVRKSLPVPKRPITPKTSNQPKPKPVSKPSTSTQSKVDNTYTSTTSPGSSQKNDTDEVFEVMIKKPSTSSTSKKRKNLKTKSEVKKQKLQEELWKDWDNEYYNVEINVSLSHCGIS